MDNARLASDFQLRAIRPWRWYDYPNPSEVYTPTVTDVLATTTLADLPNAGVVDSANADFDNDGVFDAIDMVANNVEFLDAPDKNETTNASSTDGDVCIMRMDVP